MKSTGNNLLIVCIILVYAAMSCASTRRVSNDHSDQDIANVNSVMVSPKRIVSIQLVNGQEDTIIETLQSKLYKMDSCKFDYEKSGTKYKWVRLGENYRDSLYFVRQAIGIKKSIVEMDLPNRFLYGHYIESAGEHVFLTISFWEKGGIILAEGSLFEINFDSIIPITESKTDYYSSRQGRDKWGLWRLDYHKEGFIIGYSSVTDETKSKFDSILESVRYLGKSVIVN